jgi:DNA-directed RNA polymerase specialized sigma24 family protein
MNELERKFMGLRRAISGSAKRFYRVADTVGADVDDIRQEAMLNAWKGLVAADARGLRDEFNGYSAWIFAKWGVMSELGREKRHTSRSVPILDEVLGAHERGQKHVEHSHDVAAYLGMLPSHLRETVTMHFYRDMGVNEIGAKLGISHQAVTRRINIAIEVMRGTRVLTPTATSRRERTRPTMRVSRGADLRGENLRGHCFDGKRFHRVDLRGADLRGATFVDACLFSSNLSGAIIDGDDGDYILL